MLNIRYHLVSLVAVFLALALGILLGTVIAGRGTLVDQQNALIEGIKADVNRIQKENRNLREELKLNKNLQGALFSALIREQLSQKRVVIFSTTSIPSKTRKGISDLMSQAGGQAIFVFLSPNFKTDSSKTRRELEPFFEKNLSAEELKQKVLAKIAVEVVNFSDRAFLKALLDSKLIKADENSLQAETAVFFAGGGEKSAVFNVIHLPLIREFQKMGMALVGVEESKAKVSHMIFYQGTGLSTIDNVDTAIGLIALVQVLKGRAGSYGVKPSAQALLPPLKE